MQQPHPLVSPTLSSSIKATQTNSNHFVTSTTPSLPFTKALAHISPTLSSNLNILANAGLIASRRDGRSIIYSARYETMTGLLEFLIQDCCSGAPEICAPLADLALRSRCGTENRDAS